jgi:hypothetical protein
VWYAHLRQFCQAVLDAMRARQDWPVVMNFESRLSRNDFRDVPANATNATNAILANALPQVAVLSRAA